MVGVIFIVACTDTSCTSTLSSVCAILQAILALMAQLTAALRWLNKPKLSVD